MIKISNYSLNYAKQIAQGQMTILQFLDLCRQLNVEAASLHARDLPETGTGYLRKLRTAYLDRGLSMSMVTVSTDFGRNPLRQEFDKSLEAIRVGMYLGAPILRVFAGSPKAEGEREEAFKRAAEGIRKVVEEAADWGLPVGLQNHNHGALCRTGAETIRMVKTVSHPNLSILLDTGQFAGSKGASGDVPPSLAGENYLESIRMCAPMAKHVRTKFYNPAQDGHEPWIDYNEAFRILESVHYQGIIDIVYEPGDRTTRSAGEDIKTAMPRIVRFLRSKVRPA